MTMMFDERCKHCGSYNPVTGDPCPWSTCKDERIIGVEPELGPFRATFAKYSLGNDGNWIQTYETFATEHEQQIADERDIAEVMEKMGLPLLPWQRRLLVHLRFGDGKLNAGGEQDFVTE